jgi:hypothetical protein
MFPYTVLTPTLILVSLLLMGVAGGAGRALLCSSRDSLVVEGLGLSVGVAATHPRGFVEKNAAYKASIVVNLILRCSASLSLTLPLKIIKFAFRFFSTSAKKWDNETGMSVKKRDNRDQEVLTDGGGGRIPVPSANRRTSESRGSLHATLRP